jgi:hypothetical protein
VLEGDGASRALGAADRLVPDAALTAGLQADREGELASVDLPESAPGDGPLAFDLESAAVLAAAARAGIPAACLVAIEGGADSEDVAERLGRGALPALAPARAR